MYGNSEGIPKSPILPHLAGIPPVQVGDLYRDTAENDVTTFWVSVANIPKHKLCDKLLPKHLEMCTHPFKLFFIYRGFIHMKTDFQTNRMLQRKVTG